MESGVVAKINFIAQNNFRVRKEYEISVLLFDS